MKKLTISFFIFLSAILWSLSCASIADSAAPGIPGLAESVEAECISYVGGAPVPADVKPVVILHGSDFDMGYQFFQ